MKGPNLLDLMCLAPVAIAVEDMTLTKRSKDLKVSGIDLDSGRPITLKIITHTTRRSARPARLMNGLVLSLTIQRLVP